MKKFKEIRQTIIKTVKESVNEELGEVRPVKTGWSPSEWRIVRKDNKLEKDVEKFYKSMGGKYGNLRKAMTVKQAEKNIPYLYKHKANGIDSAIMKDGIHLMFPHVVSSPAVQKIIRENVIKELEEIGLFKTIPTDNTIYDAIDKIKTKSKSFSLTNILFRISIMNSIQQIKFLTKINVSFAIWSSWFSYSKIFREPRRLQAMQYDI